MLERALDQETMQEREAGLMVFLAIGLRGEYFTALLVVPLVLEKS